MDKQDDLADPHLRSGTRYVISMLKAKGLIMDGSLDLDERCIKITESPFLNVELTPNAFYAYAMALLKRPPNVQPIR